MVVAGVRAGQQVANWAAVCSKGARGVGEVVFASRDRILHTGRPCCVSRLSQERQRFGHGL
eukprot:4273445-Lingulodinium_polyedra.AAC.1